MSVSQAEFAALLATLAAPRPVCIVCGEPVHELLGDVYTHPTCEPDPPPSTIADLRTVLIEHDNNSERSKQEAIGPSEIAVPCDRRLSYRIRSTPERQDSRVKWAPMLGTAIHATIAQALVSENDRIGRVRWLVENRVHVDEAISGSCDAYDVDTDTVVDWKLVGPTRLNFYRRNGPGAQYEGQIHMYGRGWQRAGRTPRWVRIVFLPRSTDFDEAYEWTAPYSQELADGCLDRLYRLIVLGKDLDLDDDPAMWAAVPASPGPDCRFCPYFDRNLFTATASGCPGDVDVNQARLRKFTEGLIVQAEKEHSSNGS